MKLTPKLGVIKNFHNQGKWFILTFDSSKNFYKNIMYNETFWEIRG